jgi:hypothetical protein
VIASHAIIADVLHLDCYVHCFHAIDIIHLCPFCPPAL